MSAWVLVVRNLDLTDAGILEVEARIKAALPELEPRCTTVKESLYDHIHGPAPRPALAFVAVPVAEHTEERAWQGHVRRRTGAQ